MGKGTGTNGTDHGNNLVRGGLRGGLIRMQDAQGNELVGHEPVPRLECEHGVSMFAAHGCVECSRMELEGAEMLPENFLEFERIG